MIQNIHNRCSQKVIQLIVFAFLSIIPFILSAQKTVLTVKGMKLTISENDKVFVNGSLLVICNDNSSPVEGEILNSGKLFITDSVCNKTSKLFFKTSNPFLTNPSGGNDAGTSKGDFVFRGVSTPQTINGLATKSILFNDVYIENPLGIKLKNSMIALGQVNFDSGRLLLNGKDLFLYYDHPYLFKYDGVLGTETNSFRVWDDTRLFDPRINERSGRVFGKFTDKLTFEASNIGLASNATSISAYLLVERGHISLPYAADGSVRKYFFIEKTEPETSKYLISYLDSTDYENLKIKESDFRMFIKKQDSPVSYSQALNSNVSISTNKSEGEISLNANETSLITVADFNCSDPPKAVLPLSREVCISTPYEIKVDRVEQNVAMEVSYKWTKDGIPMASESDAIGDELSSATSVVYTVTVTDPRGCFSSTSIQVNSQPVPISTFEVKTSQCQDSPIKLSVTTNLTGVDYTWNMADGTPLITTTSKDIEHTYNSYGDYTVTLISTKGNCSSTLTSPIAVYPLPEADFDFNNLCGDLSLNGKFTNKTTFPISGNYVSTSNWIFGAGETLFLDGSQNHFQPITHAFSSVGPKTVVLEIKSDKNCTSSISKTVTIDKQTVDFSVVKNEVCLGEKVSFMNNSVPQSAGTPAYTWDFGDYTSSTDANPEKVFDQPGTYLVKLSMQTGDCIDYMQKSITVHPNPDAKGITILPTTICQGESAKLEPQVAVTNGVYKWDVLGETIYETSPTRTFSSYGKVDVSLTVTSSGCSSKYTSSINVKPKPKANFTFRSDCSGKPIQFNNTSTVSGATLTYSWNIPDNETTVNPRYAFTTNTGSVDVRLIASSNGCSDEITKTVEIYQLPVIPLSDSYTYCKTTYPIDATVSNVSGCTYVWDDGIKTPIRIADASKLYTVTVTSDKNCVAEKKVNIALGVEIDPGLPNTIAFCQSGSLNAKYTDNMCTWLLPDGTTINNKREIIADQAGWYKVAVADQNCSGRDSVLVNINPLPIVSLGSDINECAGTNVTLDAGAGFASYLWSTGKTTRTIDVNKSDNYSIIVTNGNGCENSDAIRVDFMAIPEKPFTVDEISQCKSAQLYAGSNSLSYLWQTGEVSNSITVNNSGNYWVKVSNNSCYVYDTIKVNILQVDDVNLGPDISICEGNQVLLNAGIHDSNYGYFWNKQPSTSNKYAVTKAGSYLCEIKNNTNGCISSDEVFVRFNPTPRVDLGTDKSLCGASSLTLDAGNSGSTIQWGSKNGFVSIQQIVNLTEPDKYWVMVMNNYGCIASDTMQIYPTASNIIAQFIAASKIFEGDTVVFKNMSYTEPYTSLWSFGDGGISIEEHPKHIYHYPSTFNATLTVTNGFCSSTISKPITVIEDNRKIGNNGLRIGEKYIEIISSKLYPNPNTGNFTFEMETSDYTDVVVGIYNLRGELISFEKIKQSLMINKQYYLSRLTPGIYILKAWVGNKSVAYKIVKTR